MFNLRDYQLAGADAVEAELQKVRSTAVIWATGLGKSTLAAELVRRWYPAPILFICERKELVWQAAERITAHTGIQAQVEQGDWRAQAHGAFTNHFPVVASIQSLNSAWGDGKRMHKFKPKFVIVDEFHHAVAASYEKFFNYVGPECKLVGLSATPKRLDGKGLCKHFETVAHKMEIREAIDKAWLCEIAQEYIQIKGLDLSKIRTVRNDLDNTQLARVMEEEKIVQRMCQPSLEIIFGVERGSLNELSPDKWSEHLHSKGHAPFRTIMFCASVRQAELASEVMNRAVPDLADWICGKTPTEERDDKMKAFRKGTFSVMTNCAVLGEGVDVPQVEVVLQGRPTKSLALWIQQFGRGSRTLPGVIDGKTTPEERKEAIKNSAKQFVRVVDFVGNSGRHKLISSIDVLGGDLSDDVKSKALAAAMAKGKPVAIARTLTNAEHEVERLKKEAEERRRAAATAHRKNIVASVDYSSRKVDPFNERGQSILFKEKMRGSGPPATEPQKRLLRQYGIKVDNLSKKKAGWIVSILTDHDWMLPDNYKWLRHQSP